jgi:hypothetical protein
MGHRRGAFAPFSRQHRFPTPVRFRSHDVDAAPRPSRTRHERNLITFADCNSALLLR